MRVIETLSTPTGLPSILRYRRDSEGVHVAPVSPVKAAFSVNPDNWQRVLTTLDGAATHGALFTLEREIRDQSPYIHVYEELEGLDIISENGSALLPESYQSACIAAILFHEGYFVLHQGGLGPNNQQTARVILRRSK